MNNNDDKFLGRPVQFNSVGRIAEGTTDKVVRPVKTTAAMNTRMVVCIVALIILGIAAFLASNSEFGFMHTGGGHHGQTQSKPAPDSNF